MSENTESTPPGPGDSAASLASGMLISLAGFALLSVGDGLAKSAAGYWPGLAVAALRYVFGALGLSVLLLLVEGRKGFRLPLPRVQLVRGISVAIATMAFFSSIFIMPLATATAIQFTSPMLTAIISAVFLREPATRQTWIATAFAFTGVMIVLRPSFAELGWAALLPLVAALGLSCMMVANRRAAGSGSALLMQFLISAIAAPFMVLAVVLGHVSGIDGLEVAMPPLWVVLVCAGVAVNATASHLLMYLGTTRAPAALAAPMVYVQLLVALAIGALFYDDYPDAISLAGSGLIIASGVWLWSRNRPGAMPAR